jgi:hypothetical protein
MVDAGQLDELHPVAGCEGCREIEPVQVDEVGDVVVEPLHGAAASGSSCRGRGAVALGPPRATRRAAGGRSSRRRRPRLAPLDRSTTPEIDTASRSPTRPRGHSGRPASAG